MNLIHRVQCLFGTHHRDRHLVRFDGHDFRSTCSGCARPMIRGMHGWILKSAHDAEIAAAH